MLLAARSARLPAARLLAARPAAAFAARSLSSKPPGVWVTVTVPDSKREEFVKVMEADVKGSRAEPGCMTFDLLDHGNGTFSFYEIYKDDAAMAVHKTLPHYLGWAEFKKRNQDVADTQTVVKFTLHEPSS